MVSPLHEFFKPKVSLFILLLAASLRKVREKGGTTTRKLIGHSGPVYSVDFDPLSGSVAPPRYLLSASADATTRLWSLDTMTNVVAYRGHQNPVWDVKWSPKGIYFATGSRDRTARLWSTDRKSCLRVFAGHLSDVDVRDALQVFFFAITDEGMMLQCVQFHPNSLYLATGSSDWTSRLWDVQSGSCSRVFVGHQGTISTLSISPDGRYLATAGTCPF
jgi:transcription initiation factor TFIID subunit 5